MNIFFGSEQTCTDTAGREAGARPLNFPLRIAPEMDGVVVLETQFSKSFMLHIMNTIDYQALCETTEELNHPEVPILPQQIPSDISQQEELLKLIHRVIFDTNIVEGELICNNCGRIYPITNAVPNMLLEEDEL